MIFGDGGGWPVGPLDFCPIWRKFQGLAAMAAAGLEEVTMQPETQWNRRVLALCFIINAIFIGVAYALLIRGLPPCAVLLGGGAMATGVLCALAARQRVSSPGIPTPKKPAAVLQPKSVAVPPAPSADPVHRAVQVLALLQQKGRLIDFLQEDLGAYQDAQIEAAVRSIHEGCRQALGEMLDLRPVLEAEEGAAITVPVGFDPQAIRLTGNVVGQPPFQGVLRHRGWRTGRVELPEQLTPANPGNQGFVLQAAEVEVEGRSC